LPPLRDAAAIAEVRTATLAAGLKLGYFGVSAAAVLPAVDEGYTLLAVGSDTVFLSGAASACRQRFP
jgi:2-keto-3-deoxy-L-rhamnonate aldolase RhmA